MSLLTEKMWLDRVPDLYAQEDIEDPVVWLQINCLNSFWLLTEYDPIKQLGFGWCELFEGCGELGYVSLEEIERLPYPIHITEIEIPLSQLKKHLEE